MESYFKVEVHWLDMKGSIQVKKLTTPFLPLISYSLTANLVVCQWTHRCKDLVTNLTCKFLLLFWYFMYPSPVICQACLIFTDLATHLTFKDYLILLNVISGSSFLLWLVSSFLLPFLNMLNSFIDCCFPSFLVLWNWILSLGILKFLVKEKKCFTMCHNCVTNPYLLYKEILTYLQTADRILGDV